MLNIYFKYEEPMYENSGIRRYVGGEGIYPNFMEKVPALLKTWGLAWEQFSENH